MPHCEALYTTAINLWSPVDDSYGEFRPDAGETLQTQLVSFGELEEPVDIQGVIDDSLVEAANDFDRGGLSD